ncbi:MAG: ASCH domain-containing protein [Deltaproteobacteria bacterium]|nr:ASCH domain-containing protein [Deltaproteobacteria bacterium]
MKAITLRQPFASLVSIGAKTIETRPWSTDYLGQLAIHSGNFALPPIDTYCRNLLISAGLDYAQLPFGKIIAVATLISCEKVITSKIPCYPQLAFSDFTPGLYALEFADIRPLTTPVPAKGYTQLWEWEER